MKKLLVILVCGIVATASFAQDNSSTRGRWYLQAEAGANNTGSDYMNIGTFSGNIGFTGGIEFGYMFNPYFGLGAQLRYANPHAKDEDLKKYGLNSLEPSLNFNFNLSNIIFGYKAERKNFINAYAGVSGAFTSALPGGYNVGDQNENNYAFGLRGGLQYERKLKNDWAFLVDAGINCFNDKYEHHRTPDKGWDSHLDLQIGIRKYFGTGNKRRSDYKNEVINVIEKHETVTIVDTIETTVPKDMYSIFFNRDKIDILPSEVSKIKAVADFMKAHPEKVVFVFGYADKNTGTEKRNAWLANNRARVICEELTNTYNIESSRIISYDQGDKVQPFAQEEFEKNRAAICVITDFKR